jgi:integrase
MRVVLTDRFCAAAKVAGTAQADFFDTKVPGLSLRVTSAGRKAWTFMYTAPGDGRRVRIGLGTVPATLLAQARAKALEARAHVEAGRDPRSVGSVDGGAMTVADLITSYIAKHASGLRSAMQIERRLRKNVVPIIGGMRLADLHRRDITRVIDPILARSATAEAGRVFEDFRAALRWALRRGDLDRNPAEGMAKPAGNPPRERVLTDDEIRTLWNGIAGVLPHVADQRIVKLCLVTAQRISEVAGMQRAELDLGKRLWSLPAARVKNATAHTVPLSDLALALIREALADAGDGPLVFPGRLPGSISVVVHTSNRRHHSPIPHWTVHDLRRTALTGMAGLGVSTLVLGHIANHLTTTKAGITLLVYVKYTYLGEMATALDLWADRLTAILQGEAAKVLPLQKPAS